MALNVVSSSCDQTLVNNLSFPPPKGDYLDYNGITRSSISYCFARWDNHVNLLLLAEYPILVTRRNQNEER